MGTSRGYGAPTGGGWPPLKRQVTQFGQGDGGDGPEIELPEKPDPTLPSDHLQPLQLPRSTGGVSPQRLLAGYIGAHGGAQAMAGLGRGGAGTGGGGGHQGGAGSSRGFGRTATRTAQNLGGFVSRVAQAGLATALREFDLGELVRRPADEVLTGLVDRLAGPGSTMDGNLAWIALNKLRQEFLSAAKTADDVERILMNTVQQLQVSGMVVQLYGHYLYEMFCRDFYEQLLKKIGADRARRSIDSIRRTIFSSLRAKVADRDASAVNWRGAEGRELAQTILVETLQIFEGGA